MLGQPIRTVPPAALPISLNELKAHLRFHETEEDAILISYLRAAVEMAENYCGLSLLTSTWSETFSAFPSTTVPFLLLSRRPLQEVISVSYLDSGGDDQILTTTGYTVTGVGADRVSGTVQGYGGPWPATQMTQEAVSVTYTAGFGDDHNSVPEMIRLAVMMAAATWFNFREDISMGTNIADLPWSSKILLRDWRPLAVA